MHFTAIRLLNIRCKNQRKCELNLFYHKTFNSARGYYSFFRPLGAGIIQGRLLFKGGHYFKLTDLYPQIYTLNAGKWLLSISKKAILEQMRVLFEGG